MKNTLNFAEVTKRDGEQPMRYKVCVFVGVCVSRSGLGEGRGNDGGGERGGSATKTHQPTPSRKLITIANTRVSVVSSASGGDAIADHSVLSPTKEWSSG